MHGHPAIDPPESKPLEPELGRIAAIKNWRTFQAEAERLHSRRIGALFVWIEQDAKDQARAVIWRCFQGGLGLPSASTTELTTTNRTQSSYVRLPKHAPKMFALPRRIRPDQSDAEAGVILKSETALATAH